MADKEEYMNDDTPIVVPEDILKMPKEQIKAEIKQLEE